jgi:beta-aspartyl-peptidase (threonine type)
MIRRQRRIRAIVMTVLLGTASLAVDAQAGGARAMASGREAMQQKSQQSERHKWAIVLHGGAGVIERSSMTPEADAQYRAGLKRAITAGGAVLDKGGTAVDAIEAALRILEDDPLFNAGRGAVFAADGTIQMDAAIMEGATMRAGAVADVQHTRNPISLARAVMEKSP